MSGTQLSRNVVFIGMFSSRVSSEDVDFFFRGYGRIKNIKMMNHFALVDFVDERDAEIAIKELRGDILGENSVVLDFAKGN